MNDRQLRVACVKLAYENPEMREHLLPLLKQATTISQATKRSLITLYLKVWKGEDPRLGWGLPPKQVTSTNDLKVLTQAGYLIPNPVSLNLSYNVTPTGKEYIKQLAESAPQDAATRKRLSTLQFLQNRLKDLQAIDHAGYDLQPPLKAQEVEGYVIPEEAAFVITKAGKKLLAVLLREDHGDALYKHLSGPNRIPVSWSTSKELLEELSFVEKTPQ